MKKIFVLVIAFFATISVFAQSPGAFNYQAVARASNGDLITSQGVSFRISILQGSAGGTAVYSETHSDSTNKYGLVNLQIGKGTTSDDFASINWAGGPYFIQVEMDAAGGTSYVLMGTSQLLSVPYALAAGEILVSKKGKLYKTYLKDDGTFAGLTHIELEHPFNAVPVVTDEDGNSYGTVKIGNQVWMTENLRTTKYNDGTDIPLVTGDTEWGNLDTSGYCWYMNDSTAYAQTYGALYNWYTVNTNKLCPDGWHVPTEDEWTELTNYLNGLAGGRLKESGTIHWGNPNTDAINDSKFTGRPGGVRDHYGYYFQIELKGYWWSSTEYSYLNAFHRQLYYNSSEVYRNYTNKKYGYSVRCIMD
jgi:uncharacterized protein (TIGR02145 family)